MKYTLLVVTAGAVLVTVPANGQGQHVPIDPRTPSGQLPPNGDGDHHDNRSGHRVDERHDPVIWDGQHRDRGRHRGHDEHGRSGERREHDDHFDRGERGDHDGDCDDEGEGEHEHACGNRSDRNYPDGRYPDGRYPDGRYPDGRYPDGRYPDTRYPSTLPDMIWGTIFGRGQAVNEVRRWIGTGEVHSRVTNDGRNSPQVVSWYDAGGRILQRWVDQNRDGRADQVEIFRNGRVVRIVR